MTLYRLTEFAELDSTNRYAAANLARLAHGDVIQAAIQTAGRGRWQRSWVSHLPGNLCLSLVLKPQGRPVAELPLVNVSQWLALCTCRVLAARGVTATLKWPNDILVHHCKIAGILAETVVMGGDFLGLVLGIGINLNLDAATLATIDQPATALNLELGRRVDVAGIRDALLTEFFNGYDAFLKTGFAGIRAEYLALCPFLGREVEVRRAAGSLRGVARDITAAGELELRTATGTVETVSLGEMFVAAT